MDWKMIRRLMGWILISLVVIIVPLGIGMWLWVHPDEIKRVVFVIVGTIIIMVLLYAGMSLVCLEDDEE